MGSFEGNTLLPKIAAILLAIALLFHLIAIGAPWWSTSNLQKTDRAEHIGLWKYCSTPIGHPSESCYDFVDIVTGDWIKAAEAFMILALFTLPAALAIVAAYAFVAELEGNMKVLGGAMGLTAVAGIFTLICVGVWAGCHQEYFDNRDPDNWAGENIGELSWAFGVAVTDSILTFISLALLIGSLSGGEPMY